MLPVAFPDSLDAWLATVHPDDRVRVRQVAQRAAAGRSLEQAQYRIAPPHGEVRWVEAFGQSYAPAPGDPLYGARGVVMDITERKRTEDALREREAQLQAILDHTQAVFYLKDLAGRYLLVNRRWEQLTHWTLDAVRGRTDDAVFPPEAAAQFRANDRQALEQGGPYELEEEISLDGARATYFTLKFPLYDAAGAPYAVCGIGTDVTARKEADRERLLAEVQRINAELQQFASIVSHDLNEPLRTMRSFVDLLARQTAGALGAEAQESLAFVTDAAQRMQQLLADLLAYTRAGQKPKWAAVHCEAVLARALQDLQLRIAEAGAAVTHEPLPTVQGDAARLAQVLQNLIGNALKFRRPEAPPHIHVAAVKEEGHWRFAVRDNGIGVDPRHADRIFQVFQRLHTRQEYPGTGMGLAICKRIVEQHGGRLWVESAPGVGATFYFTIRDIQTDNAC